MAIVNKVQQVLTLFGFVTATISAQEAMVYFHDQGGDYGVWQSDSIGGSL